jgi:adenylate kinase
LEKLFLALAICIFSFHALAGDPNIILFGLPGVGKGTLAQKLIEKNKYVHICPGNLLRAEVRSKTDFGKQIEPILARGDYVPEQLTFAFLKDKIVEAHNNNLPIIFDGYPRSVEAVEMLDRFLKELNSKNNTIVIHLKIEPEKLLERVLNRAVCNKCNKVYTKKQAYCSKCHIRLEKRPQDTAEILKKRIEHYIKIGGSLMKSFEEYGYKIVKIHADNAEQVLNQACKALNKNNDRHITYHPN